MEFKIFFVFVAAGFRACLKTSLIWKKGGIFFLSLFYKRGTQGICFICWLSVAVCWLLISYWFSVFGRPHRVAPTNNLNSRSLVLSSFLHLNKLGVNSSRNFKNWMPAFAGMTFLVYNRFFNLSFLHLNKSGVNSSRNPVLCFSNQQPAISNWQCIYLPLTFILSPQGLTITHIFIYIIRSRYILIFEENYGWFVVLSSLLTPNFNALLNPI